MASNDFRITTILAIIMLPWLFSCSAERRIAMEYIKNDSIREALVIPPDYLFKTSLKAFEYEDADTLSDDELDSALYASSLFLQFIDDSVFIESYYMSYCSELTRLGFRIYEEDSLHTFLSGKTGAYIINLAQLELEEYVMPVVEKQQFEDYLYYQVIDLNAVNLNSWIEISRMNDEEEKKLYFYSLSLTDEVDGSFKYQFFKGEVSFEYTTDSLRVEQVYWLGEYAAKIYAGLTFDYLMNQFLDRETREQGLQRSDIYYHYDRERHWLRPAGEEEQFIPMEGER